MLNTKLKLFKNQKGMTLMELLAVVVILGIVAAVAVPAVSNLIGDSETKADTATATIVEEATLRYINDQIADGVAIVPGDIGIEDLADYLNDTTGLTGTLTVTESLTTPGVYTVQYTP